MCLKETSGLLTLLLKSLMYLSYACAAVVLIIYLLTLRSLRHHRNKMHDMQSRASIMSTEMKLLRQSLLVFSLYATSILSVFAISFAEPGAIFSFFVIAYIENLLNLSISAVYPICFLIMSGEMKRCVSFFLMERRHLFSIIIMT
ncbi:hypothetical protein PENTCL1PPCAC_16100, partial [Pristionchus entomophagus]